MLKRILFAVCFLAGAGASTTSPLPEMRTAWAVWQWFSWGQIVIGDGGKTVLQYS